MPFIKYLLVILLTSLTLIFFINRKIILFAQKNDYSQVITIANEAKTLLSEKSQLLKEQLTSFSQIVSNDMDFAMKLSVDHDFTAPEISEFTFRYIGPMKFDYLSILDSSYTILSSAHFPAGNGNIDIEKSKIEENRPILLKENLKGEERLTLQVKVPFRCAGVKLFCVGGVTVDSVFLKKLVPSLGAELIIRFNDEIYGANINSISEIKEQKLVIDNIEYLASVISLSLPNSPELIITAKKSEDVSLLKIFR